MAVSSINGNAGEILIGASTDASIAALLTDRNSLSRTALSATIGDSLSFPAAASAEASKVLGIVKPFGLKAFAQKSPKGYEVGYQIDDRRTAVHTFETYASAPGGYTNLFQLVTCYVRRILGAWDSAEPSVTTTGGAGWATVKVGAAFGGNYLRSTTAGNTLTWKAPPGLDKISLISDRSGGAGGYSKVTITDDLGAPVAPVLLPTAQAEVDAGRLATTALIAKGGTLAPTDYVLNLYGSGSYAATEIPFVSILDVERGHTVVLTVTGYKQSASTDTRLTVDGFAAMGPYTMRNPQRMWKFSTDATIGPAATISAHEYAISTRIGGNLTTIGNVHGYDSQTSFVIRVDGVDITSQLVTTADLRHGANVEITRTSELFHPGAGGKVADAVVKYVFTPGHGMTISHRIVWAVGGACTFHYPVMWPLGATRKASFVGTTSDLILTANDLSRHSGGKSPVFYAWQAAGDFAVACEVNPKSVKGWKFAPTQQMQVEDRNSTMIKLYVPMVLGPDPEYAWLAGEKWESEALYRVARIPGADRNLSRP